LSEREGGDEDLITSGKVAYGLCVFVIQEMKRRELMKFSSRICLSIALALAMLMCSGTTFAADAKGGQPSSEELRGVFRAACEEYGVPVIILKAVAYKESAWVQGSPSCDGGYGIMHLVGRWRFRRQIVGSRW